LYYESNFKGITVKHVYQKKYKSTVLRLLGFVYWHIVSLTIGFLNILIGKLKGAKVIYNVQGIYPDLLIEEGGLKSKPVIAILKWLEHLENEKKTGQRPTQGHTQAGQLSETGYTFHQQDT